MSEFRRAAEAEAEAAAALGMLKEADAAWTGGQDPAPLVHANMQRVKVYSLTNDSHWEDQGTGHVTIDYIEGSREIALAVVDEVDNETILLHNITSDRIYRIKDETIISWKDPEKALEIALSFQEAEGCKFIWENMVQLQEKLQSGDLAYGLNDLPPLELSSLPLLLKTVLEWGPKDQMRLAELISQNRHEFFPKLVELFRMCESSRNMDGLHMIFRLVKEIISLNNSDIFCKIFSDDFILDIIGALEYDPEALSVQNHRDFVKKQVFNKAVRIGNPSVASMIRNTYIISYLKDDILLNALDAPTVSSLKSIVEKNKSRVVCVLKDDASFIQDLIARIRSSNTSAKTKGKLVLFLHEFCNLGRSLQDKQQLQLFRDLIDKGVLKIISDVLQSQDKELFSAGVNILMHCIDQDPDLVRKFIAKHEDGNSFLEILVQGMVIDFGEGLKSCLKTLLHTPDMTTISQDLFLQGFFEKHIEKLIDVIASSCHPKRIARSASGPTGVDTMVKQHSAKLETLLNICDILSFCARHHTHRIKRFFVTNAMEKVLILTRRKEKALVVAAVQLMQNIIGTKDDFLVDHVIKQNLLKPVIKAFVENGDRDNKLRSVILELLEYIRKENLELLIEYVAESFWDQLVRFEQLPSILAFRFKYKLMSKKYDVPDKMLKGAETKQSSSVVDMSMKVDERGADKGQEGYYNKDSDSQDSATPAMHSQEQSIPASTLCGWADLPIELLTCIFSALPGQKNVSRVCKHWRRAVLMLSRPVLLRPVVGSIPLDSLPFPPIQMELLVPVGVTPLNSVVHSTKEERERLSCYRYVTVRSPTLNPELRFVGGSVGVPLFVDDVRRCVEIRRLVTLPGAEGSDLDATVLRVPLPKEIESKDIYIGHMEVSTGFAERSNWLPAGISSILLISQTEFFGIRAKDSQWSRLRVTEPAEGESFELAQKRTFVNILLSNEEPATYFCLDKSKRLAVVTLSDQTEMELRELPMEMQGDDGALINNLLQDDGEIQITWLLYLPNLDNLDENLVCLGYKHFQRRGIGRFVAFDLVDEMPRHWAERASLGPGLCVFLGWGTGVSAFGYRQPWKLGLLTSTIYDSHGLSAYRLGWNYADCLDILPSPRSLAWPFAIWVEPAFVSYGCLEPFFDGQHADEENDGMH